MVKFSNFILFIICLFPRLKKGVLIPSTKYASILYTAVVKGKVALPCDISPPAADDGVALILWYKDDSPAPIYTMDARRGTVEQARQSANSQLESRAYFNMINRPAFLQLDPVQEEDAGDYRCRVDFHKARTVNTVISLKVIVPPGEPVIKDHREESIKGLIGPYNEGESLTLICDAEGGKPRPAVTWWKEYTLLDDTYTFMSGETSVRNDLEISELTRADLLTVYTCQASNNNITVPASTAVTLDLNLKPVSVQIQPEQRALSANKPAKLTCIASGSRPSAVISWWKGSKELTTIGEVTQSGDVTKSVLSFTPLLEDNGNFFSCRAQNPVIPSSALEEGWKLEVHYAPQVSLQLGRTFKNEAIQEGNDVYFECNIRSNPWVSEITWFFEERELRTNVTEGVVISNQSLVLQKVQKSDKGRYYCLARNSEGQGKSNEISLQIKYAPVCKSGSRTVYGVGKMESVKVLCDVEADPADLVFRWNFNTSSKSIDITSFTTNGLESTATYTAHSDEEYGSLVCSATNEVGKQREPCVFSVIPAGPPDAVQNCSVQNQTETTLQVDCLEGYDGGLTQYFTLEVYDGGELRVNMTSSLPTFVVQGLPSGTILIINVYASNSKGRGPGLKMEAATLRKAEKLMGMQGMIIIRPVLGLLIGVVIALVIISVTIIIWMKVKRRAKRLTSQAEEISTDKCNTPLKKDTDDMPDGEEKGPDIIPANIINRAYYTEEAAKDNSSPSSSIVGGHPWTGSPRSDITEGLLGGINSYRKTDDVITYVELQIPRDPSSLLGLRRKEPPPTDYATLDMQRHVHLQTISSEREEDEEVGSNTCETPLMNNRRESAV